MKRLKVEIENAVNQRMQEPVSNYADVHSKDEKPMFEKMEVASAPVMAKTYTPALLPLVSECQGGVEYFADQSTKIIRSQIKTVLMKEAPVCHELLCRRILDAWGILRIGPRISERFDKIILAMKIKQTIAGETTFYWDSNSDPDLYNDFRVPSDDDATTRRNLENIAPEEVASAIKKLIDIQVGLTTEDLQREVAKIFGFSRCTEGMTKAIGAGIDLAMKRGWVVIDGERVSLTSAIQCPIIKP